MANIERVVSQIKNAPRPEGLIVSYGRYEIGNCGEAFTTATGIIIPCEWRVLAVDKNAHKALLLTKNSIMWEGFSDSPMFERDSRTSWESSYLRKALNHHFFNNCFSSEERGRITPTYISPETPNGKRALDHIFLLSAKEVEKYLPAEEDRIVYTPFVAKNHCIEIWHEPSFWWTRSLGEKKYLIKCISREGTAFLEFNASLDEIGVRPAMWIRI